MGKPFIGPKMTTTEDCEVNMVADTTERATERVGNVAKVRSIDAPMSLHLRMPATVCPTPGGGFDAGLLEDWIVGAFFVNYARLWSAPPCVAELMEVSGRSHARVTAALDRLVARGWLGRAKVRHQYAPGQWGHRWRIWLPAESPLVQLRDAQRGDGFRWIAVPMEVARARSVLTVATYLVCSEQRRLDGAITTTPSDLAALLRCDRTTAWRNLGYIGAVAVTEGRPGSVVYDLPVLFAPRVGATVTVGLYPVHIVGNVERVVGRWNLLTGLLDKAGRTTDVQAEIDALVARVGRDGLRMDLLIRVLESKFRRVLMRSSAYRPRLALRFGSRLRSGLRRSSRAELEAITVTDESTRLQRESLRAAVSEALSHTCSSCDGDRLVIVADPRGGTTAAPCPSCT